jgi:phosphoserine phosphatase
MIPCDYEGKVDFMRLLMREYGLKPEDCAFVCEGENDIPLAKEVGLSIAFNGAPALQSVATHSINQPEGKKDLKAILKFFK